jgi:hypothetical protein
MALPILEQTEHTGYGANALILLAMPENDQSHSAEALDLVEHAAPVVEASGNRADIGRVELERARAELGLGNKEEAASRILGALPLLVETHPTSAGRGYAAQWPRLLRRQGAKMTPSSTSSALSRHGRQSAPMSPRSRRSAYRSVRACRRLTFRP